MKRSTFGFEFITALVGTSFGILTMIWSPGNRKRSSDRTSGLIAGVIIALIGAGFGVILTMGWDAWKQKTQHREEYQRAVKILKTEVTTNIKILETDKEYLIGDNDAADKNAELVTPLIPLSRRAWETVYLAGTLSRSQPEFSSQVQETYDSVEITNQRIQAREFYRTTNQSMSNFGSRRKLLNGELLEDIEKLLPRFKQHQQVLESTFNP